MTRPDHVPHTEDLGEFPPLGLLLHPEEKTEEGGGMRDYINLALVFASAVCLLAAAYYTIVLTAHIVRWMG